MVSKYLQYCDDPETPTIDSHEVIEIITNAFQKAETKNFHTNSIITDLNDSLSQPFHLSLNSYNKCLVPTLLGNSGHSLCSRMVWLMLDFSLL